MIQIEFEIKEPVLVKSQDKKRIELAKGQKVFLATNDPINCVSEIGIWCTGEEKVFSFEVPFWYLTMKANGTKKDDFYDVIMTEKKEKQSIIYFSHNLDRIDHKTLQMIASEKQFKGYDAEITQLLRLTLKKKKLVFDFVKVEDLEPWF